LITICRFLTVYRRKQVELIKKNLHIIILNYKMISQYFSMLL
jgi:hypothetical protein